MTKAGARADWEARIDRRRGAATLGTPELSAPAGLHAQSGAGQVTLSWEPVEGAAGYAIYRGPSADGPWELVDHESRDVLHHPGPAYADTTGAREEECFYRVAAIAAIESEPGAASKPVAARPGTDPAAPLELAVRADEPARPLRPVWHMIGSERLSQLLERSAGPSASAIAKEFDAALVMARDELGADRVRAHAILHDDLGVYREDAGEPVYDFSAVDRIYDRVLEIGLRPIVELSFMPRDLASDPAATVFEYGAIISPPRDWDRWGVLIARLTAHLVDRYGAEEVRTWGFEVWNEANLEVFWTGTEADYLRLYDVAAAAVKDVDARLPVGGPATAAAGWITSFLDHVIETGAPLDFLTTHTYGNLPLDVGEALRVRGLEDVQVWWTEWGVTPTHFNPINDTVFSAVFLLHGMKSVQGRAEALAYWVVSDHFEELGRAPSLLHGGFGLLALGNLRKPRWWALVLAEQLGTDLVEHELHGDGARSLVDAWAARAPDGGIDVLVWNGTLDQSKANGDPLLDRTVKISLEGLRPGRHSVSVARVDERHSNLAARWTEEADWPDAGQWEALRAADRLDEEQLAEAGAEDGRAELVLELPMPGIARVRLRPLR